MIIKIEVDLSRDKVIELLDDFHDLLRIEIDDQWDDGQLNPDYYEAALTLITAIRNGELT